MSAFGDLALPADFVHFPYVDPKAPKGGTYSEIVSSRGYNGSFLTFNSLNAFILKGTGAFGMEMTFATLMTRSGNEPDAMYGLAARAVRISDDGLTYTFLLRPETTFHDGTPLTAHDVVWSFTTLKDKGHPIVTQLLREFKGAEAPDDRTVVVHFAEKRGARRAAVRRRAADLLARLLRQAAVRPIDARRAARQRRLQGRPRRCRAFHRIRARQGLVGRRSAGRRAG